MSEVTQEAQCLHDYLAIRGPKDGEIERAMLRVREAAIKAEREAIAEWVLREFREEMMGQVRDADDIASSILQGHHLTKAGKE